MTIAAFKILVVHLLETTKTYAGQPNYALVVQQATKDSQQKGFLFVCLLVCFLALYLILLKTDTVDKLLKQKE